IILGFTVVSSGGRPHDFTRRAAGSARLPSSATGETTIRPQQEASRMNRTLCAVGFAALCATWTAPAVAGIADSPLPVLSAGATTFHLYSVPGVIRSSGLGTFFACTSTDTATMQVGVEVVPAPGGAPGNDAVATSLSVAPGATVMFGT